jgi:hypothetical protein
LVLRCEVFEGRQQQAAGKESQEGNPTAKRLHALF